MNKKRWFSVSIAVVAILVVAFLGSQIMFGNYALAASDGISGSWAINIMPDPSTGVPQFANFSIFTKDGLVVNSNQVGLASIGVWEKGFNHAFHVSFQGYEEDNGQLVRYLVRSTIELSNNKEQFNGLFITDIFDLDGNLLFSINGTVSANRMDVEPIE